MKSTNCKKSLLRDIDAYIQAQWKREKNAYSLVTIETNWLISYPLSDDAVTSNFIAPRESRIIFKLIIGL